MGSRSEFSGERGQGRCRRDGCSRPPIPGFLVHFYLDGRPEFDAGHVFWESALLETSEPLLLPAPELSGFGARGRCFGLLLVRGLLPLRACPARKGLSRGPECEESHPKFREN